MTDKIADSIVTAVDAAESPPESVVAKESSRSERRRQRGSREDTELDLQLAVLPLTDLGNAERFVARYGHLFKWCGVLGWLAWDGKRWSRQGADGLVDAKVHNTVRAIQREAEAFKSSKDDYVVDAGRKTMWSDKIRAWGRTSEANSHLACIPKLAAPYLEIHSDELDADRSKINVDNGTIVIDRDAPVDTDCVSFRPHDPADLITKISQVSYDPDATCQLYDDFLAYVQPGEYTRRFLHQWGGSSLTGDTTDQVMTFQWGKGKNGKSTLFEAWGMVAGDYGASVPIETFLDQGRTRAAAAASPDLADLAGIRFLRTSEPERNAKLAEAQIKALTGGEPIKARHLNRDFFSFWPQFKLTMSGNYRPKIVGTDEGIWRRVILVPWTVTVPVEKRDKKLGKKLRAEASGILNRLLDGIRDWVENGLTPPAEVLAATENYRSDSDPLGRFLATCVRGVAGTRSQSTELYRLYCAWAKAAGENEWTINGFGRAMKERGYRSKQSNVMWWLDLETTKVISDFIDDAGNPIRGDRSSQ
jgi:putative DNA primase/helicase